MVAWLTLDHIIPRSRGGTLRYENVCTACVSCNTRKGVRTPDEAKMPLVYVPYRPNLAEEFLLMALGRHRILADQHDFLVAGVGKNSRLQFSVS